MYWWHNWHVTPPPKLIGLGQVRAEEMWHLLQRWRYHVTHVIFPYSEKVAQWLSRLEWKYIARIGYACMDEVCLKAEIYIKVSKPVPEDCSGAYGYYVRNTSPVQASMEGKCVNSSYVALAWLICHMMFLPNYFIDIATTKDAPPCHFMCHLCPGTLELIIGSQGWFTLVHIGI